ncbi:MAG: alpha/beta hydrolase [Chloroflexota bacterium]|nr:alpha/beta hydrolase [Chloroflexota bacterium]
MNKTAEAARGAAGERPRREHVIVLADGRRLAYAEYGDPAGTPVFFFHGYPGSRLEASLGDDAARGQHVRVIAPDRPGFGLSDPQRGRRILDWPRDVVQLADGLGVERFAVVGISGGGPYAAACAYAIPERLTGAAIISGVGPFDINGATEGMSRENRVLFWLARRAPQLTYIPLFLMAQVVRRWPQRALRQMMKSMPEPDRRVLSDPATGAAFIADAREAFRQGIGAAVQEGAIYARPWGFRLEDVRMPVHLWQGGADTNVPPVMGRYQAQAIPNCIATFYEDEGHLLGVTHLGEILAAITG